MAKKKKRDRRMVLGPGVNTMRTRKSGAQGGKKGKRGYNRAQAKRAFRDQMNGKALIFFFKLKDQTSSLFLDPCPSSCRAYAPANEDETGYRFRLPALWF